MGEGGILYKKGLIYNDDITMAIVYPILQIGGVQLSTFKPYTYTYIHFHKTAMTHTLIIFFNIIYYKETKSNHKLRKLTKAFRQST